MIAAQKFSSMMMFCNPIIPQKDDLRACDTQHECVPIFSALLYNNHLYFKTLFLGSKKFSMRDCFSEDGWERDGLMIQTSAESYFLKGNLNPSTC